MAKVDAKLGKNEDDLRNKDGGRNEDDLKNEGNLKNEDDLKKKAISFFVYILIQSCNKSVS